MQPNSLYFGDNLKVLSERLPNGDYRFPTESVDLIYLDPPFNSNRAYNLLFKEQSGEDSDALIKAFDDTWKWDATARDTYDDLTGPAVNEGRLSDNASRLLDALVRGIGHNDMSAYLVMMTPRLAQLHRILKGTGSLWLHCDPTASHYLKILMDAIFGPENFRNEVIWKRTSGHSDANRAGNVHDVLLFYSKSPSYRWNRVFQPYDPGYVEQYYRYTDESGRKFMSADLTGAGSGPPRVFGDHGEMPPPKGRHWMFDQAGINRALAEGRIFWTKNGIPRLKQYLDQSQGLALQDVWTDVQALRSWHKEGMGYPTQKPVALLERILQVSSQEGDLVLDPFCGCGTALIGAEKLKRQWVGIDITHLSIAVMRARLMDSFGLADVPVFGVPADLESARMLAAESKDGRYEFQWWALAKIDAKPLGGERRKGADRGIDGVMTFSERDSIQRILVSVKSGKPKLDHVKELIGTLQTEKGAIGVLLELDEPTKEMERAALEAGQYESELWGSRFDKIQILTVAELLAGKKPNVPKFMPAYQKAARIAAEAGEQQALWEEKDG